MPYKDTLLMLKEMKINPNLKMMIMIKVQHKLQHKLLFQVNVNNTKQMPTLVVHIGLKSIELVKILLLEENTCLKIVNNLVAPMV